MNMRLAILRFISDLPAPSPEWHQYQSGCWNPPTRRLRYSRRPALIRIFQRERRHSSQGINVQAAIGGATDQKTERAEVGNVSNTDGRSWRAAFYGAEIDGTGNLGFRAGDWFHLIPGNEAGQENLVAFALDGACQFEKGTESGGRGDRTAACGKAVPVIRSECYRADIPAPLPATRRRGAVAVEDG